MKNLTIKELEEAPSIVQFIYQMSVIKQPLGIAMIEEAMRDYPEYFPRELDHRRKWALIPASVHEEYEKERELLRLEMYKDMPESKGLLGWIRSPTSFQEWNKKYSECYDKEKSLAIELYAKYYSEYGIQPINL